MTTTRCVAAFATTFVLLNVVCAQDAIQFNRDIRPIFIETCLTCHGPDSASRKADLRMDQRDAAIEHGAISPGKPDESEMIRRIMSHDPEEIMPPPEIKKPLNDAEKKLLVDWIQSGAEYQQHWSYIAPVKAEVPAVPESVKATHANWPKNRIDNFVLQKLFENGLTPAAEADRRTLARRVSLDITGIPPAPEVVAAFVHDKSANAYETLVDSLLASPNWGEHRGRYWLDYARYADTHGIHFDNYREIWAYRDWVIKAFNKNMPFDEFTIENLAGDLLPNATLDQQVASGFNRCNMTTNEGGIIDEEYAVLYTRDRTETVSAVWMGLTAGCATCHSHKFDQLSHQEFYEMAAFFNNTTQAVRDGNIKDTPPIIAVPMATDRERFDALPPLITTARTSLEERRKAARPEFETWATTATPETLGEPVSADGLHLLAHLNEGQGKSLALTLDDSSVEVTLNDSASWTDGANGKAIKVQGTACELADVGDFESDEAFSCAAWINVPANDGNGAISARMANGPGYRGWDFWMQQRRVGMHIISAWPDKGMKVVSKAQVPANEWVHVAVTYDGSRKASGLQVYINGAVQDKNIENDRLDDSTIRNDVPWKIGSRSSDSPFTGSIQDLRIQRRVLSAAEVDSLAKLSRFQGTLAKAVDQRTPEETNELYNFWLKKFDASFQECATNLASLEKEEADIRARGTIAHVMNEKKEAAMAFVLYRGEYDQRRDQVTPGTPAAFPPFPQDAPRNRLGFAEWLLKPEHPLTARVTVNRFWQEIFGTGLVRTTGDLGVSGEIPINQDLLDWLAVEFREGGWDIKKFVKMIVMSATYRQAATVTPEKLEKDPANRLLSRGPRFRMDAEMVRDYALEVSGLLVPKIGGPSVKPYQPPGVWESIAMNGSTTSRYVQDQGDDLYRRSLYTFVKRMAPPASLDIFNSPNREQCTVRRDRTNTPLQALVTLNDVQFVEAARRFAEHILKQGGSTDEQRLQWAARRLLSREFRTEELPVLIESLGQLTAFYKDHPSEAAELIKTGDSKPDASLDVTTLAAWTMLCNEMMNLDEVLNK